MTCTEDKDGGCGYFLPASMTIDSSVIQINRKSYESHVQIALAAMKTLLRAVPDRGTVIFEGKTHKRISWAMVLTGDTVYLGISSKSGMQFNMYGPYLVSNAKTREIQNEWGMKFQHHGEKIYKRMAI
jgi:hypothetical protein